MVLIVRDDAAPRFVALANLMRWHRKYAKATVEDLWENSQAAGAWEGSAEDILFWAGEADADPEVQKKLLAALQHKRVRFISQVGDDLYKIHGNQSEIAGKEHRREVARLNAQRRWDREKARAEAKCDQQYDPDSDSNADGNATGNADGIPDDAAGNANGMQTALPPAMLQQCLNQAKPSQAKHELKQESPVTRDGTPSIGVISLLPPDPPPRPKAKRKRAALKFATLDLELARTFQAHIARHNPDAVLVHRANLNAWANTFRLMRERDGLSYQRIGKVMQYATGDPFWGIEIQCPEKLRAKWDRLTREMREAKQSQKPGGGFSPQGGP